MKKYKDLLKNIGLLTISNFGSKLLGFFLIPLYTSILTTEEYGAFDLVNVTITLLIPILTLCIYESVLRFLLSKKNFNDIIAISIKYIFNSVLIVSILLIVNNYFNILPVFKQYSLYFLLLYIVSTIYSFAQSIARGLDKLSCIAISGLINSLVLILLNILFLVVFKLNLDGYFIATIVSNFIAMSYIIFSTKVCKNIKSIRTKNKSLEKEMVEFSKPMVLDSTGWWINNVSDRYIVTIICGTVSNGIYSVAYKIPSLLTMIQTIFNQAWGISAIKSYEESKDTSLFKNIYVLYNIVMVVCCSLLLMFNNFLAKILFMNEFYKARIYGPFLIISVVFSAMSGMIGGIFSATKDTKILGRTTIIGAIANIMMNLLLVYKIGVIGAAISTAISCFIVWLIRYIKCLKIVDLTGSIIRESLSYFVLLVQVGVIFLMKESLYYYIVEFMLVIIEMIIYYTIIKKYILRLRGKKHGNQ